MKSQIGIYESPISSIAVGATESGISELSFSDGEVVSDPGGNAFIETCIAQLDEYFRGGRRAFDVPLDLKGTDFQMSVWRALLLIPYGRTSSYGSIASALGRPKAVRAVGGANHRNPVSIIVPCHRVIGHDGGLTGYGGGLWRKQWLLDHESKRATRTGDTDGH